MNKRQQQERLARRKLKNAGWDVQKTDSIQFNHGSETIKHVVGKSLAAFVGRERGYRVDSEVAHSERGEIDILWYGTSDPPVAIELETSPTMDTIDDKISRYVEETPIRECFVLNLNKMPVEIPHAYEWIGKQL